MDKFKSIWMMCHIQMLNKCLYRECCSGRSYQNTEYLDDKLIYCYVMKASSYTCPLLDSKHMIYLLQLN